MHRRYEFRLYAAEEPRQLLATLVVARESIPWERLSVRLSALSLDRDDRTSAAEFVGDIIARELVRTVDYQKHFLGWQEKEVHITPVHHYQPIPDTRAIPEQTWSKKTVIGVDLNLSGQLRLLRSQFPAYKDEYNLIPIQKEKGNSGFYIQNGRFEGLDPYAAYCLIRYFKPHRIMEIGGGYSSLLMARAALRNGSTRLETVEPYPVDFLEAGFPGLAVLHKEKVESLPFSFFDSLGYNDILFIDSSHVVKTGGDVNYLFLEILPRLKPGVIVHVHDINFPFDYPRNWVIDRQRFWSEQYLLQGFLTYNSEFEVLFSSTAMTHFHPDAVRAAFPARDLRTINRRRKSAAGFAVHHI